MRWFSRNSILYLHRPGGARDISSSVNRIRNIARNIMQRYIDAADPANRAFAREILPECKAVIDNLREPVNADDIFSAFDNEEIQEPVVGPCRAAAERLRTAASTSH